MFAAPWQLREKRFSESFESGVFWNSGWVRSNPSQLISENTVVGIFTTAFKKCFANVELSKHSFPVLGLGYITAVLSKAFEKQRTRKENSAFLSSL